MTYTAHPYRPGQVLLGGTRKTAYVGAYESGGAFRHVYLVLDQNVTPVKFTVEAYYAGGSYAWSDGVDTLLAFWEPRGMHPDICRVMRETMAELAREER